MKKSIKIISILLVLATICGIALMLNGCMSEEEKDLSRRKKIKSETELEVPIDSKIIFHRMDEDFVNGRHSELTVFQFETEPSLWLQENNFLSNDDILAGENRSDFHRYFNFRTFDKDEIPREYVPNFEKPYLWIEVSNVYFFYYPDNLRLIVYIAWS